MSFSGLIGHGPITLARDYIIIGGDRSPGQCIVEKCDSPRGWDIRKGYALSGATVVPSGDELSCAELSFSLWTQDQIDAWDQFAARYFDRAVRIIPGSRNPKALTIQHPILNRAPLRVTEFVVKDASELKNDGTGLWVCHVSLLQYRKAKPALARPLAALSPVQQPKPTAKDAQDREIESLMAERQRAADAEALKPRHP